MCDFKPRSAGIFYAIVTLKHAEKMQEEMEGWHNLNYLMCDGY